MVLSLLWASFLVILLQMASVLLKERCLRKKRYNEIFLQLEAMSYWLISGNQQKLMHYCYFPLICLEFDHATAINLKEEQSVL